MSTAGQVIGGIAGAILSVYTGNVGFFTAGLALGGALDPPEGPTHVGPRLDDLSAQTASYGSPIGNYYGTAAGFGTVFWVENNEIREVVKKKKSGGKGGGGETTTKTYEYYATFAVAISDPGPIDGVGKVWMAAELISNPQSADLETLLSTDTLRINTAEGQFDVPVTSGTGKFRVYSGTDDQLPDSRMEADLGAGNTPAYRGLAYVVLYDWPLEKVSNTIAGAQVKAEVINGDLDEPSLVTSNSIVITDVFNVNGSVPHFHLVTPELSVAYVRGEGDVAYRYQFRMGNYSRSVYAWDGVNDHFGRGLSDVDNGPWDGFDVVELGGGADIAINLGRGIFKNGIWYAISTVNIYRGSSFVDNVDVPAALAVDDEGNICVFDVNGGIKIYDEDLNNTASYSILSSESLIIDKEFSTASFDSNYFYLFAGGGTDLPWKIYRIPTDFSGFDGPWLLDQETDVAYNFNLNVHGNLLTRVYQIDNGVDDELVYEVWKLPVFTSDGIALSTIVSSEMQRSELITAADIDVALLNDTVSGYRLSGLSSIRANIEPLRSAYQFDVIPSGYKIKAVPRGQASSQTLDFDDLIGELEHEREMETQLPYQVHVTHLDSVREYDTNVQQSIPRVSSKAVNISDVQLPIVLSVDEAAEVAEIIQSASWLARETFKFSLPPSYRSIEPADVVTLTTDDATFEFLITKVNYQSTGQIDCEATLNDAALYTTNAVGGQGQVPTNTIPFAGDAETILLDIPLMRDADDEAGFGTAMAGFSSSWKGGTLLVSKDNEQTYDVLQGFSAPVTSGAVRDTIGSDDAYVIDRTNTITIDLFASGMTLDSITEAQMLAGTQHWFAWGIDGRWEICLWAGSTLNADGSYTLDTILRGQKGTEWATGLHASGDYFVLLDDADIAGVGIDLQYLSVDRHYKGVTQGQDIDEVTAIEFDYDGENLKPLSVVNVQGSVDGSNNWDITWSERTRYSNQGWWGSGIENPSEPVESYEIDIMDGSTVVRTLTSSTESVEYTAANQTTDFGSAPQTSVSVKIYKMSTVIGRGYPNEATLFIDVGDFLPGLFIGGKDGFAFDFREISTLWQDVSATTPADNVGDPVRRADDQSGNGNNATYSGTTALELASADNVLHLLTQNADDCLVFSGLPATSHWCIIIDTQSDTSGVILSSAPGSLVYAGVYQNASSTDNNLGFGSVTTTVNGVSVTTRNQTHDELVLLSESKIMRIDNAAPGTTVQISGYGSGFSLTGCRIIGVIARDTSYTDNEFNAIANYFNVNL